MEEQAGIASKRVRVSTAADTVAMTSEVPVQEWKPSDHHCVHYVVDPLERQFIALDSEFMTDVTIRVGSDAEIECHKTIVSLASPKLAAILRENEPRLPNVDPSDFILLLQIIYTGKTYESPDEKSVDTWLQLGRVAHELQVHAAVKLCASSLAKAVDSDNLWQILDFANLVGDATLEESCFEVIRNRAGYLLQTEGFLKCDRDTLEAVLTQDVLYNVTELQLYQACVAWANTGETESRRASLQSALGLIRFHTISAADFAEHVCPTGLLSVEEERDILRSVVTGKKNFMPVGFSTSTTARDPSHIREIKVRSSGERKWRVEIRKKSNIKIRANRDIFIHGVKLQAWRSNLPYGRLHKEKIKLALKGEENGKNISEQIIFRGQVKNGDEFSIKFKHPCEMKSQVEYSLRVLYPRKIIETVKYQVYQPSSFKFSSGLEISVLGDAFAPPELQLIIAEKSVV